MRGPFWVSTPENDKTDKKRSAGSSLSKPQAIQAFQPAPPVQRMWDAVKKMQEADRRRRFFRLSACDGTRTDR